MKMTKTNAKLLARVEELFRRLTRAERARVLDEMRRTVRSNRARHAALVRWRGADKKPS